MVEWTWESSMEKVWPHKWYSSHSTDNKRYTKINKYKALLAKEDSTKSIEYEERLIDYDENYENYNPYLEWNGLETSY